MVKQNKAYFEKTALMFTAIRASENNSGRYQCFFNRFNSSLMWVEKIEQPNLPKTVFCQ